MLLMLLLLPLLLFVYADSNSLIMYLLYF